jgi:RNA polymerase sigma-70 factor (ECF subfamily)
VPTAIADFRRVLEAAKAGDERAVGALFDELQPPLLAYLRWREPRAAEDLAGEVWLAVAKGLRAFSGDEDAFRAWVFAIARRRVADLRRRSLKHPATPVAPELLPALAVPGESAGDPAATAAERSEAEAALALLRRHLSPDQAEVVVLRVLTGMSVEATARAIGKRPGAVRILQHRALRRLAARLTPEEVARALGGEG